jgi:hypothetical protein
MGIKFITPISPQSPSPLANLEAIVEYERQFLLNDIFSDLQQIHIVNHAVNNI